MKSKKKVYNQHLSFVVISGYKATGSVNSTVSPQFVKLISVI